MKRHVKGVDSFIGDTGDDALRARMKWRVKQLDWTLLDLERKTGESYRNIQRWLGGDTKIPAAFVAAFAANVPVNARWLLEGSGSPDAADDGAADLGLIPGQLDAARFILRWVAREPEKAADYASHALHILESLGMDGEAFWGPLGGVSPAKSDAETAAMGQEAIDLIERRESPQSGDTPPPVPPDPPKRGKGPDASDADSN